MRSRKSMRLVLATAPGERPMRPEFGCAVHDLVFAPVNDATGGTHPARGADLAGPLEPRIEVRDVTVTPAPDDPTVLHIDVRYSVRGTNNPRQSRLPFYVIPSEAPYEGSGRRHPAGGESERL
ncbi:GPW/gp25 family protein [Streptomyces clavuligerus]|uniref:GPW/gp25 family protein n=1 Tax=Streptomyces clavuligerus TaxID=1901 RepID=UPI0013C418AF|nr:GPW/gp25 family protein [Streptomyces clavuligerus]